jgi:hypothetical protein
MRGSDDNVSLFGAEFKVIETNDLQINDAGERCYAVVDRSQGVIWIHRDTPLHLRQQIISEAIQQASLLVYRPVLST